MHVYSRVRPQLHIKTNLWKCDDTRGRPEEEKEKDTSPEKRSLNWRCCSTREGRIYIPLLCHVWGKREKKEEKEMDGGDTINLS